MTSDKKRIEDFEKVVTEFQDGLFRFAYSRTGSSADAEDIVQDVLVRFYHNGSRGRVVLNPKAYLFRAVSNHCNDYLRDRHKNSAKDLSGRDQETYETDDGCYLNHYDKIIKLLSTIPAEQAEVIRLRCIAGMSFVEIAELSGQGVTTVKSRFKYGIDKIRTRLNVK